MRRPLLYGAGLVGAFYLGWLWNTIGEVYERALFGEDGLDRIHDDDSPVLPGSAYLR